MKIRPTLRRSIQWLVPLAMVAVIGSLTYLPRLFSKAEYIEGSGGTTYYVRTDGGTATECTGLSNVPYPGSGTGQACAWNHPFVALPPQGTVRITGGDTLVIGHGEYEMGYNDTTKVLYPSTCNEAWTYSCFMAVIPSGPDAAHPTRIIGEGFESKNTALRPQLWGTERTDRIINLASSSNVDVSWLELTDHSDCGVNHADVSLRCVRDTYPHGTWAANGIYASDSTSVRLEGLDVHGFAGVGIWAGRLTDWTVQDVRVGANSFGGWNFDLGGDSPNNGTLTFKGLTVEWNGCSESYPDKQPVGCWSQSSGGYGDGIGTNHTGGTWVFEDSQFLHNTQDGLDLLYLDSTLGGSVSLNRVRSEGNAGNQIKINANSQVTNSVVVGNCDFFNGKSYTFTPFDNCRAAGDALVLSFTSGSNTQITNSTVYGGGNIAIFATARFEGACSAGTEKVTSRNSIIIGGPDASQPGDTSAIFYQEGCSGLTFDSDYDIVQGDKVGGYVAGSHDLRIDPKLLGPLAGDSYGMQLAADSPAINAGILEGAPSVDYTNQPRGDGQPDLGAYEYQEGQHYLQATIQLSGRRLAGKTLEQANHSEATIKVELVNSDGVSLSTPRLTTMSSDTTGLAVLSTLNSVESDELIRELTNNPGITYGLKVKPLGYLPQIIPLSDASIDAAPLTFSQPFVAGNFADGVENDRVALADFSILASYYNGGPGTQAIRETYKGRAAGSLLSEFATLAYHFNK